jgi:hypothetical protein
VQGACHHGTNTHCWRCRFAEAYRIALKSERIMPYTRPYRRFYLTPPSLPLFAISLVLAIFALLVTYAHLSTSIIHASQAFTVLVIAYLVLLAGVLFRGI